MDIFYNILKALVVLVLLAGLFWSIRLRAKQKGEMDTGPSSAVKAHPITRNPVILSYLFIVGLAFALIWIFKLYYKFPF